MKYIFGKKKSLNFRFFIALVISIIIIITDSKVRICNYILIYLEDMFSPFYFLQNRIKKNINELFLTFIDKKKLNLKNQELYKELLLNKIDILKFNYLNQDNINLRILFDIPFIKNEKKTLVQILSIGKKYYNDQILIDKGSIHGVYEGQILVNDKGIVGQVISVNKFTSRALLICNSNHALPVQIIRNSIRTIAIGNGCHKELQLDYLSSISSTGIKVGDFIITSGLGGRFPKGYPVGKVSSINFDNQKNIFFIHVSPIVNFRKLNYLILLWNTKI